MEQRKRANLALGSFLRMMLGWSLALPEAERAAKREEAQNLMAVGEREHREMTVAAAKGREPRRVEGADDSHYRELRDVILPAIAARSPMDGIKKAATKEMEKLAATLPVFPWCQAVRGFGAVGLAVIVAEAAGPDAHNLSDYPTVSKLYKRMCLAVFDGKRQGGLSKAAPKAEWIRHGYSRERRSRMWNVGHALVRQNGDGRYRHIYLARKEYERERAEAAGLKVVPAPKIPKGRESEFMSVGHIDKRAQRYMEKRLLKDLWIAWRQTDMVALLEAAE